MFYNPSCIEDGNFLPATWLCAGWIVFLDYGYPTFGEYITEWYEDGMWFKWIPNFMFAQMDGPDYWFYSGTKKQGFAVDTWGDGCAFPGDCYYLKKVKCRDLFLVMGKDMESLKEEAKNKPSILKDRSNKALKGFRNEYCERIREDKAFKAERFEFGEPEEETEE